VTAQDVTNNGTSTTGPLRFSLWWTPNGPFPAAGSNTAQYNLGTLAAGQHFTNVDSGLTLPFTDPGNGCYYVALVLEQFVNGAWQTEDYGGFSLRISSGQGCMFSFTGSPLTISSGQSAMLTWSTGGTSATLDNGLGARPPSGSVSVSPTVTTTYTCSATGTADSTPRTAQVTITVSQVPTATFSASPTTIALGASSTLTWSTTNATTITIDNGVGSKPASGTASVSPAVTTTYTLTASSTGGTATKTATVTVVPPPTVTFTAIPSTVNPGQGSTLSWSTTNAANVSIDNGLGAQPLNGSIPVLPSQTTTYTLTATGTGGTTTRQATVTVSSGPTLTFTASPSTINAGQSTTLTWSTTNATNVSIDNGIGLRPANGSLVVSPLTTTVYVMVATGPGGIASAEARVTVIAVQHTPRHRGVKH
jgi:PKD repeat protein